MILYSKQGIVENINSMKKLGRLAHSFLLVGEKGVGKKVMAEYIAKMLMCENGNACGECRHCRRIHNNTHPDVIRPERTGKKQIYTKDAMRLVCSDAFVYPNDCESKVYIFADCESIEETTQNLMLKLIEEPPDHVYFIFTAVSRSVFLPTILSRVITLGVNECTHVDCKLALNDIGKYSSEQIEEAVLRFHGNIGNCIEFLNNGEICNSFLSCKSIIDGMIASDEYEIIKSLAQIGENRDKIREILLLTDKAIRDACVIRINYDGGNTSLIGCYPEGSERLSSKLSFKRAETIHNAILDAVGYCAGNVNVSVAMSALGGVLAC